MVNLWQTLWLFLIANAGDLEPGQIAPRSTTSRRSTVRKIRFETRADATGFNSPKPASFIKGTNGAVDAALDAELASESYPSIPRCSSICPRSVGNTSTSPAITNGTARNPQQGDLGRCAPRTLLSCSIVRFLTGPPYGCPMPAEPMYL